MEQVLRIFRKDIRHLWPGILVVLALVAVHAAFVSRISAIGQGPERIDSISTLLNMLLPLAIWFLIAQVIFQEAIPGERQFWLTRPYNWSKLLASKVLFVVVFISVPLFLSDCYILAAQGLPVRGVVAELLFRQVIVAMVFILPSFVLAALTTGLTQFLLAWFLLLLTFISTEMLVSALAPNRGLVAIHFIGASTPSLTVLAVVGCGIVIWQYAERNTAAARLVLVAVTFGFLPMMMGLSRVNQFRSPDSGRQESPNRFNIRIAYDHNKRVPAEQQWQTPPQGSVRIRIPLTVVGLPPEMTLSGTAPTTIQAGGRTWPEGGGFYVGSLEKIGDYCWQTTILEKSAFDELKQQRTHLHVSYNLDVLKDEVVTTVPVTKSSFFVPGVGVCHSNLDVPQFQMTCRAGLTHRPEVVVRLEPPVVPGDVVALFPKYSTPWGLSPTTDLHVVPFSVEQTSARLAFDRRRKLGAFRSTLDLENIQLADYTVRP